MSFSNFNEILREIRKRYRSVGKRFHEAEALSRWEPAVGPLIAKHARPLKVQNKVLWVEVDHPVWSSELLHRKAQILKALNEGESNLIEDILFLNKRNQRVFRR